MTVAAALAIPTVCPAHTSRIAPLPESAMYTLPAESKAIPDGASSCGGLSAAMAHAAMNEVLLEPVPQRLIDAVLSLGTARDLKSLGPLLQRRRT